MPPRRRDRRREYPICPPRYAYRKAVLYGRAELGLCPRLCAGRAENALDVHGCCRTLRPGAAVRAAGAPNRGPVRSRGEKRRMGLDCRSRPAQNGTDVHGCGDEGRLGVGVRAPSDENPADVPAGPERPIGQISGEPKRPSVYSLCRRVSGRHKKIPAGRRRYGRFIGRHRTGGDGRAHRPVRSSYRPVVPDGPAETVENKDGMHGGGTERRDYAARRTGTFTHETYVRGGRIVQHPCTSLCTGGIAYHRPVPESDGERPCRHSIFQAGTADTGDVP